jgi:hypothetical protein
LDIFSQVLRQPFFYPKCRFPSFTIDGWYPCLLPCMGNVSSYGCPWTISKSI